jgi:hypothetical protein
MTDVPLSADFASALLRQAVEEASSVAKRSAARQRACLIVMY